MKVLVTGAAGFIGSHLCEALLGRGDSVIGIDDFTPNYARDLKLRNIAGLMASERFSFLDADINAVRDWSFLESVDAVCHLAGMPGVRSSWLDGQLDTYIRSNVMTTNTLLLASHRHDVRRFVYASSSSIYGGTLRGSALMESSPVRPTSPYAVTKFSGESLTSLFGTELGLSTVSLRFFTVFGPRQRPDMAINRIIGCTLSGTTFTVFGDGSQVRDFTFVDDIVAALVASLNLDISLHGDVFNVGGGSPVRLLDVISVVEDILSTPLSVDYVTSGPGDPHVTESDISAIYRLLGWSPSVPLEEGLLRQIEWQSGSRNTQW